MYDCMFLLLFFTHFFDLKKISFESPEVVLEKMSEGHQIQTKRRWRRKRRRRKGYGQRGEDLVRIKFCPDVVWVGREEKNLWLLAFENPSHTEKFANRSIDI